MKTLLNTIRKNEWINETVNWLNFIIKEEDVEHVMMKQLKPYINRLQPIFLEEDSLVNQKPKRRTLQVRLANKHDVKKIFDLELKGYDGYQAWAEADFRHDLETNPRAVYILLEDQTDPLSSPLIGMITGRARSNSAHISHLIIHPDFQDAKLGSYLLELWIKGMEFLKIPTITLEVRESNMVAQHVYKKHGFVVTSSKANYYRSNNETALNMKREQRTNDFE